MVMDNRLRRLLRSPLGSCRPRDMPGLVEKPSFVPRYHQLDAPSPKPKLLPSICKPDDGTEYSAARRRVSEPDSGLFVAAAAAGGRVSRPPTSPALAVNAYNEDSRSHSYYDDDESDWESRESKRNSQQGLKNAKDKKEKKKKKKKVQKKKRRHAGGDRLFGSCSGDSSRSLNYNRAWWWSSSEDEGEDETATLFSSRTFSSDSSPSCRKDRRQKGMKKGEETRDLPLESRVEESFAVVKSSSDPYNDFRTSMVEMIVEKQIFAAAELEQLLKCFLSLNSRRHHRIIVEVFLEIYEALFSSS